MIDDCTIGGWNKTCGSSEKLRVHAVDEMVAYLSWTMSEIDPFIAQKIVGKTYDLTSACKQFGIHARDRKVLRIATWNADEHRVALLGVNALPFGATGSVSSFFADFHRNLVPRGPMPEPGMDRNFSTTSRSYRGRKLQTVRASRQRRFSNSWAFDSLRKDRRVQCLPKKSKLWEFF